MTNPPLPPRSGGLWSAQAVKAFTCTVGVKRKVPENLRKFCFSSRAYEKATDNDMIKNQISFNTLASSQHLATTFIEI